MVLLAGCGAGDTGTDGLQALGAAGPGAGQGAGVPSETVLATPVPTVSEPPMTGSRLTAIKGLQKSKEGVPTGVVLARPATGTAVQRAIVRAWVDYGQVRMRAFLRVIVDGRALAGVADGQAAADVRTRVAYLRANKLHNIGVVTLNPTQVTLPGTIPKSTVTPTSAAVTSGVPAATLRDCINDSSKETTAAGVPQPGGPRLSGLTVSLRKQQGRWLVTMVRLDDTACAKA